MQTARNTQQTPTIQQKDELDSGRRAKRLYLRQNILDRYRRTAGCPDCAGIGLHTEECRARIEQEMVDKCDAIYQETIAQKPDVSLKKRKISEPDISPGGASSLMADTLRRGEFEQGSRAGNENLLAGCNRGCQQTFLRHAFCRSQPRSHCTEWKVRGDELPPRKHAYDMVWVDEWRGDRLCVRQFKAEGFRDDLFAGTPDTFFIKYLLAQAASCKDFGILVIDISVAFMHARTDDEIYVKVPSGIKNSKYWRFKAAVNGTRKASQQWQEYSSDKLVTSMLFQQNDINPCIHTRFCDDLDLEQRGDDFLVCGVTRSLEKLTEEFNRHVLVKKSEIVSLKPEHQSETHFHKRRIDIAFSTKEIMREAAGPTTASKTKLKRIARYIKGRQRCVLNFPWVGKLDDVIHVTVDADWAGNPKTRCSTPRGAFWQLARASQYVIGQ